MQRSKGFTLIELLVVIAIIAILAAILFPVFAQARAKARAISCLSNLKQIGTATQMYIQDYDETFPAGWNSAARPQGTQIWRISLQPYIQKVGRGAEDIYADRMQGGIMKCPDLATGAPTNYGYNSDELVTGWDAVGSDWANRGRSLAAIHRPASLVAYADAGGDMATSTGNADPNFKQGEGNCNIEAGTGDCGPYNFNPDVWKEGWSCDWNFGVAGRGGDWRTASNNARRPIGRHNKQINAVFADGHAKALNAGTLRARLGTEADVWHNHNVPQR